MKKMLFIVNPRSGMLKVNRLLPEIIGLFNENGYEVTIYITAGPQDATNIVLQRAKDHDLVVCAGGDGTLNETISGVLQSGLDLPIGYIPAGSTNDFAASLNLPLNVLDAARLIVEGEPAALDVGQFEDRYFSYVASFGAFTKAAYSTNQSIKNALGHLAYVLEGIQEIPQIRKNHVRIEADGIEIEDDFIFGAISNSTSVGGILKVSPDRVDMADGKFEIFLVRLPRDPMELSECILALTNQTYDCSMIIFRTVSNLTVYSDPDMAWTLDGERADGQAKISIKNLHHGIRLISKRSAL